MLLLVNNESAKETPYLIFICEKSTPVKSAVVKRVSSNATFLNSVSEKLEFITCALLKIIFFISEFLKLLCRK